MPDFANCFQLPRRGLIRIMPAGLLYLALFCLCARVGLVVHGRQMLEVERRVDWVRLLAY
jgi:hypothetical protein